MASLPKCNTLTLREERGALFVTLNRPEVRNAMSLEMVTELEAVLDAVHEDRSVRAIVLRGAGGHFCAGGDIKDMAQARAATPKQGEPDAIAVTSRRFGTMITKFDRAPQAVVAVLEGAVLGGGLGLACIADVALAHPDANFGLPETSLGLPPAQIAPFLVRRLGRSMARRLAITGGRFDGRQAEAIGLVHEFAMNDEDLERRLDRVLDQVRKCAPGAIAVTKHLMLHVGSKDHDALLDEAAERFAEAARGPEGEEGMKAFLAKRKPVWAEK